MSTTFVDPIVIPRHHQQQQESPAAAAAGPEGGEKSPQQLLDTSPFFIPRQVPLHLTPVGHPLRRLSLLSPESTGTSFKLWFPLNSLLLPAAGFSTAATAGPLDQQQMLLQQVIHAMQRDLVYIFEKDIKKIQRSMLNNNGVSSPNRVTSPWLPSTTWAKNFNTDEKNSDDEQEDAEAAAAEENDDDDDDDDANEEAEIETAACVSLLEKKLAAVGSVPSIRHWYLAARFVNDFGTFLQVLSQRSIKDAKRLVKAHVKQGRLGAEDAASVVAQLEQFGSASMPPRSTIRLDDRWQRPEHRLRVLRFGMWCSFIGNGIFRTATTSTTAAAAGAAGGGGLTPVQTPVSPNAPGGSGSMPVMTREGSNNSQQNAAVPSSPMLSQAASLSESFVPLHVQLLLETGEHELRLRTRVEEEMADEVEWWDTYGALLMEIRSVIRRFMDPAAATKNATTESSTTTLNSASASLLLMADRGAVGHGAAGRGGGGNSNSSSQLMIPLESSCSNPQSMMSSAANSTPVVSDGAAAADDDGQQQHQQHSNDVGERAIGSCAFTPSPSSKNPSEEVEGENGTSAAAVSADNSAKKSKRKGVPAPPPLPLAPVAGSAAKTTELANDVLLDQQSQMMMQQQEQQQQQTPAANYLMLLRTRPNVALPIVFLPKGGKTRSEIELALLPSSREILRRLGDGINSSSRLHNTPSTHIHVGGGGKRKTNGRNIHHHHHFEDEVLTSPLRLLCHLYDNHLIPVTLLHSLLLECYTNGSNSSSSSSCCNCHDDDEAAAAAAAATTTSQADALMATSGKRLVVLGSDPLLCDGGALERAGYAEVRKNENTTSIVSTAATTTSSSSAYFSSALLGLRRSDYQSGNILGRLLEVVRTDLLERATVAASSAAASPAGTLSQTSTSLSLSTASFVSAGSSFPAIPEHSSSSSSTSSSGGSGGSHHHQHHGSSSSSRHHHHHHGRKSIPGTAPAAAAVAAVVEGEAETNEATIAAAAAGEPLPHHHHQQHQSKTKAMAKFPDLLLHGLGDAALKSNCFEFRIQNFALLIRPLHLWWTQHLAQYCLVKSQAASAQLAVLARAYSAAYPSLPSTSSNDTTAHHGGSSSSAAPFAQLLSSLLQSGRGPIMCALVLLAPASCALGQEQEEDGNGGLDAQKPPWCSWIDVQPRRAAGEDEENDDGPAEGEGDKSRFVPDSISDYFTVPRFSQQQQQQQQQQLLYSGGDKYSSKNSSGNSTPSVQPLSAAGGGGAAKNQHQESPPISRTPSETIRKRDATPSAVEEATVTVLFHIRFDAFETHSLEQMTVQAKHLLLAYAAEQQVSQHGSPMLFGAGGAADQKKDDPRRVQQLLASTLATGARVRVFFGAQNFSSRVQERLKLARTQENSLVCALMAAPRNQQPQQQPAPTAPAAAAAAANSSNTTTTTTTSSNSSKPPPHQSALATVSSSSSKPARKEATSSSALAASRMSQILSFLYLGSANDAGSNTILQEGVTHVLNASHVRVFPPCSTLVTQFLGIPDVGDRSIFDIKSVFPVAFALIDSVQKAHDEWQAAHDRTGVGSAVIEQTDSSAAASATVAAAEQQQQAAAAGGGKDSGGAGDSKQQHYQQQPKILVHCEKGKSRSAAIVAAYLMRTNGWLLAEALHYIRLRRPGVEPNLGFIEGLKEFERELEPERSAKRRALHLLVRNPAQSLSKQQLTRAMRLLSTEEVVDCSDRIASDGSRKVVVQFASPSGASRALAASSRLAGRMTALGGRVWLTDFEEAVMCFSTG